MAEPRRIPLDTVKSLAKEKKPKDQPPTLRFCLTLEESNDKTCPEYSYSDLVKTAREDKKEQAHDDPFGDDDDDDDRLKEIARKYEEKYGPKVGKKNRKKFGKWEDYIDRGMGYDETDPFIDNDEAYDELVPSTLTTQYGGFYINSGELEFRAVSDSDSQAFHDEHKPRKKRRKHKEFLEKDGKKRRKLLKEGEHIPKKRGRKPVDKSFSALNMPKKRRQPTVAVLLQQHKSHNLQSDHLVSPNENSFQSENEDDMEDGNPKEASISEVIESVIKAAGEDMMNNGNIMITAGSSDSDEHIRLAVEAINAPKLPDNLAPDLEEILTKLKQIAYVSEEGKCKFFSGNVNRMLLSVEMKSRELPCSHRSMIYSHLASHLPCTKETLLKRAKKLRMDQEIEKLRGPFCRLKEAIAKIVPGLIEKYETSCKLYTENRLKEEKAENDGEAKKEGTDDGEKPKFPKKMFEWNDEIRQLLCDLVRTKMTCYETSKMRNQTAEEYVWQFLELEVKNLWPIGWMKTTNLYKESREAHGYLTSKPKKSLVVPKKPVMPLGVQVPSLPSAVNRLPSGVALSPIATGQELAEGVLSNIKVPTTSVDDGESLGALIAVTTANSALLEEQKPHVMLDVQKPLTLSEVVQKSLTVTEIQKTLASPAEMQKVLMSPEAQKSLVSAEVKKPVSVSTVELQNTLKTADIPKSLILSEASVVTPRTISVVTTSVPLQQREKESVLPVVSAKPITTAEIKATAHSVQDKSNIAVGQMTSPGKRIFTLMSSGDAAQLQAQQASQKTSLASQMLDKIICASLANFPNSGTSINDSARYSKQTGTSRELNAAVEQNVRSVAKSMLESTQVKVEPQPTKPSSPSKIDSQTGSPGNIVRPSNGGVSILKSAYHSERPIIGRTLSLPEQGKTLTTTVANSSTGHSSRKFPTPSNISSVNTVVNTRQTDDMKIPCHKYEFLEAFKRTFEGSPEPLQSRSDSSVGQTSSKVKTVVVETRELCEEPMNYKKIQNPVDTISSLIPQDFSSKPESPTVVHLASNYKSNQQLRGMQLSNPLRVHRSSPETVSTPISFPEGMKGFPLPIKSQSTNPSCISSLSTPSPAHGLGVNRTSPAQAHEPGFTSPHRHNSPSPHRSVSAHSPSHGHPASSGTSSAHNPYQSTPLSHYPPVETAHNRSMLQNQWRVSSPSTTTSFPSQYSTSSPSPSTSSPTSQTYQSPAQTSSSHHHSVRVPNTTASQGSAYSHNQPVHNISQQITPAHSTTHKNVESLPFTQQSGILPSRHSMNSVWQQNPNRTPSSGQAYSNSAIAGPPGNEFLSQSRLGQYTESSFTAAPQHLLTPYHSFPLSSHSGTTQQSPHHRVP